MASGDGILGIQKSSEIKLPSGARLKYQENSSGFGNIILKKKNSKRRFLEKFLV